MKILSDERIAKIIIDNLNFYRDKYQFKLFGYVIMPEHIHLIILPGDKGNISQIMRDFKKYTSIKIIEELKRQGKQNILKVFEDGVNSLPNRKYKVWEEEFFDRNVFTKNYFLQKLHYIHKNPIVRGLVKRRGDYKYSSYINYYGSESGLEPVIKVDYCFI